MREDEDTDNRHTARPGWSINLGIWGVLPPGQGMVGQDEDIGPVVNADAFWARHNRCFPKIESLGVDYLGVASIDEGIILCQNGIKKPVPVLSSHIS